MTVAVPERGRVSVPPVIDRVRTVDAHVGGQTLRLVVDGLPHASGRTMRDKQAWLRKRADGVRRALACFLRGFEDPAYLEELKGDYAQLSELDRVIADMEAILQIAVWHMPASSWGFPTRSTAATAAPGRATG